MLDVAYSHLVKVVAANTVCSSRAVVFVCAVQRAWGEQDMYFVGRLSAELEERADVPDARDVRAVASAQRQHVPRPARDALCVLFCGEPEAVHCAETCDIG